MKITPLLLSLTLVLASCSGDKDEAKVSDSFIKGELAEVAKARGLTPQDLIASVKTYNPSGASDEYLAFYGTGVSGRLAVVSMPAMKILKYVSVFSAEPWQGYAFDDESKAIIKGSSRDEIEYTFGDMGTPALSLTKGNHDARAIFISDASNGRIGLVDLAEYEAKQVVTNPIFKNTNSDLSVSTNTEYIAQTTLTPEKLEKYGLQAGATFWKFVEKEHDGQKHFFINQVGSFSVLLPPAKQSSPSIGKGVSEGFALSVSREEEPKLNIFNWKTAESLTSTKSVMVNNHFVYNTEVAQKEGILKRVSLPSGASKVVISGNGELAVITNSQKQSVHMIAMKDLLAGGVNWTEINVGGPSIDAAFTKNDLYVTVHNPNQLVRISQAKKSVTGTHALDFPVGKITIPGSDTAAPEGKYASVVNHSPYGRFTSVGPQLGLSAHLVDIGGEKMQSLYDASIPQATRLGAVAMSMKLNKPIFRYKIGTDPRSGVISSYRTPSGKELVVRDGKRVHVYATVIRSHITPDFIEVEQGDIVSIHITSNEQSRDQTHGFTIDTYNVHGSWEPGKTATLTFVADRPGVFPYYCTEFCSALHLEMQGYLLVKPMSDKKVVETDNLLKLHSDSRMNSFFNYIKGQ